MTTRRVVAALTTFCLLCQPAFGFTKMFPEFDDEPGVATFFRVAITTVGLFIGSTVSTQESSADEGDKLAQTRDDAASFVASDSAIRGMYLQAVLQVLRQVPEYTGYSDLQLAAVLPAWQPWSTIYPKLPARFPPLSNESCLKDSHRSIHPPPTEDRS